jgi:hypothetical protein
MLVLLSEQTWQYGQDDITEFINNLLIWAVKQDGRDGTNEEREMK